ncbi:bacterial low temperature requirement protein A [Limosilactobacillus frumenti DSM 13145]|uniref:Bacterial low temperature requirement protein A n=1 Tax=Limosilactobacillus frumenti DSM 13145 TaxID=1423746 RepID=A0A0R1P8C4_9LACO|nr:low temperature requirement protein A [Limosilactobacillus frumenti]KRL26133.1 bacterial low temperature requirement protein A [Limosilactobacillus frumenti DSM 13145]
MKTIIAKKVSMLELFYDLIFVYAISKITAMIHHPVAGGLPMVPYLEFIIVIIIVMQIWLYQALYINRFGRSRTIDTIGLLISMFAMTYLANNINTDWSITFRPFNEAVLLIVASLLGQYLFGSGQHPLRNPDLCAFMIALTLEFIAVFAGLMVGYNYGINLCVLGGLIGFIMPLAVYHQFLPEQVNFPHLVERLSLIIIITFGETLVNVTRYFTGPLWNPFSIILFLFLATLFGTYVIQSDFLINHHQRSRGFVLMYSHVFMIIALLSLTAGLDYLPISSVSRLFLWSFLSLSLIVYDGCLLANQVYHHSGKLSKSSYLWLGTILILGIIIAFVLRDNNLGLISGLTVVSAGQCGYLLKKAIVH